MYRLMITEKSRDVFGKPLEILGSYNPYDKKLVVKKERIEHWIKQGAGMSPTVNNLLVGNNIIAGEKVKASKPNTKKKNEKEKVK